MWIVIVDTVQSFREQLFLANTNATIFTSTFSVREVP